MVENRSEFDRLKEEIKFHVQSNLAQDPGTMNNYSCFVGLAYSVRDRLIKQWIETQQSCTDCFAKRMFYLSCEFLPGRFLMNYLTSLGIEELAREVVEELGFDLEEIEEEEWDAGLGNGGLGRLASCYMDSVATLGIPGYGYGIHYDYGIFHQTIVDGYQQEKSDNWMRRGNPWDILRSEEKYMIQFYGRTEPYTDIHGRERFRWVDTDNLIAMASDLLIPGFKNKFVTNMRLWVAVSDREFDLEGFNRGDYIGAVESKILSETISKVLYPSDEIAKGRELRLKQQFFFVSASLQDILKQFKKEYDSFEYISKWAAIQLNDTHPSIAIPEFMRLLMDEEGLNWDEAWKVCQKTFAYTNHTVLPEALETWPVKLIGNLLPRHLEIIFEINQRFLKNLAKEYPDNPAILSKLSIIQEDGDQKIRMAHLAIVGSHSVNGVAALHTEILKRSLFKEFD
ncbi:MAG: glycogen/starch/alpha-glucan family phosphorylase, partial [Desulfobacteraceae bacterium]|nr:glycogen/starch/alpha-glucan family phosphorylase [Desulfobacteraceae bacterium]